MLPAPPNPVFVHFLSHLHPFESLFEFLIYFSVTCLNTSVRNRGGCLPGRPLDLVMCAYSMNFQAPNGVPIRKHLLACEKKKKTSKACSLTLPESGKRLTRRKMRFAAVKRQFVFQAQFSFYCFLSTENYF